MICAKNTNNELSDVALPFYFFLGFMSNRYTMCSVAYDGMVLYHVSVRPWAFTVRRTVDIWCKRSKPFALMPHCSLLPKTFDNEAFHTQLVVFIDASLYPLRQYTIKSVSKSIPHTSGE